MERRPWEKQLRESSRAFAAFAIYRDLGLGRSISKASQAHHEDTPDGASVESLKSHFGKWSVKWNWVSRAEAYDLYVDERRRSRMESRRDQILERIGQSGQLLSYAALRALAGDAEAKLPPIDPRNLNPSDIVRFVEAAAKLELQSLGQVTDARGVFLITPAQHERMIAAFLDVCLLYVEPERQEAFLRHAAATATGTQLV